jgi:Asp/Glu/hydantoin racemase
MRLLIVNPNTSADVTARMLEAARGAAGAGVEFLAATAPRGLPYISSRAEAQIGGAVALEMLADAEPELDAAILAAFGDPGLFGAKELFDFPIVGVSEAAMLTACLLGGRFLIVTFTPALCGWFRDCVAMHGLEARCAGVAALDRPFNALGEVQDRNGEALIAFAAAEARAMDAASVIFGGAPLAGLAARAREMLAVPVVDPIAAAVKQAEALVALRPKKAAEGGFRRPAGKASIGLSEPLADVLRGRHV